MGFPTLEYCNYYILTWYEVLLLAKDKFQYKKMESPKEFARKIGNNLLLNLINFSQSRP